MSGHKANRNNIPKRNPEPTPTRMTAVLDQLATDANTQRREDPNMVALEPNLKALRAEYLRLCGHLDEVTAGAALLVVGQLCAAFVNRQSEAEQKVDALAALPNLIRLVGAQLYAGTTTDVEIACPFTYLTGAPCTKTVAGATRGMAELLMKGHVWQHHPEEEWPPAADEGDDGDAADAVNLAPTNPAAQAAAIADLEAEFPDDGAEAAMAATPTAVWLLDGGDGFTGDVYATQEDARAAAIDLWVQREAIGAYVTEVQARSKAFSWRTAREGVEQLLVNGVGDYLEIHLAEIKAAVNGKVES